MNAPSKPRPVPESVSRFLAGKHRLYIGGRWVDAQSGATLDIYNPSTGKRIATAAMAGPADVDAAVKAARHAFDSGPWGKMSPIERRRLLLALADAVEAEADDFAMIDSLNMGIPMDTAPYIIGALSVESLRYNAGWAGKINGETITVSGPEHHAYTLKEPIGVIGAIVPWNSPLLAAMGKLAPALAAGCTVVLKPADFTPLSVLKLAALIDGLGFPEGVINIVPGLGDPAGQALVDHPLVDKIAFTGSTAVGQSIVQSAATTMKRLSLELGGKSPVFIFPDADLDKAIAGAANSIFRNAGQICAAGSRLFVHKSIYDRVMAGVTAHAQGITVGDALTPGTQMGPLASQKHFERVQSYIETGRAEGAEIVTGGGRIGQEGYFVQPTMLAQTNRDMRVVREEIFGPVVAAVPFDDDDLDRIAALGNDTDYGLAAYVWTGNISTGHKMAKKLHAGLIMMNGGAGLDRAVPFGGYGLSGWGREYGREGIENYFETKSVTIAL